MSSVGLKQLCIEHLRGSVAPFTLVFEKGKNLTVVYGENGSGKSTVCDALDLLGNGKVGSLEGRGLGQAQKFWPSAGKALADIAVKLDIADGSMCRVTVSSKGAIANPKSSCPVVEVLRRAQILSLIEAQPGDRYNAIKRFIDVSGVESSEASLRTLIRDLRQSQEVAVARVRENLDAIESFWQTAGKPGPDALTWAQAEAKRDPKTYESEVQALTQLHTAYTKLTDYPQRFEQAKQALRLAKATAAKAAEQVQTDLQAAAQDAGELISVLQSAQHYLRKHPSPAACPLCESSERVQGLQQRISERLAPFSALRTAQTQNITAAAALQRAEQSLELLGQEARQQSQAFEGSRTSYSWSPDVKFPTSTAPDDAENLATWLAASSGLPAHWQNAITDRKDKKQFIETLQRAVKTYSDNASAQTDLDTLLPNLERTLKIVEEERRVFVDGILSSISTEVGRIYEAVHPGEGLNKISLQLDPNRRASLGMLAEFCGNTGVPPQAYFSDSHLDTLGLCIFLALAARDKAEDKILVLDDVLGSVDEPHVDRLVNVLYDEASNFRHCVITTHYRPWRQKLRWGWLKNGQCQFVELSKWTNATGLTLVRTIPDVEQLRTLLAANPPDPQLVCAKGGVILEAVLDFITLLYECSVPRRASGLYTLGELLPAIKPKLRDALEVEIQVKDTSGAITYQKKGLSPIITELDRIARVRNVVGCHFNALSFDLLDSDALGFGQLVLELVEAVADPDGGWPRNDKSGKYWANAGETRRLHPLQQPK